VKSGFRRWAISLALVPTTLILHIPFPSGGNRWSGHLRFFTLLAIMLVPNTFCTGTRASLSHIFISRAGYV